ncbi:TIGR03086 family metal-binding protein [Lentzea nigeriaca]|uniref:TIGR03086 family metal-binding protein n=1 Tax=Lentzea nigeriaca TaxID=1128665 RepID=UPI00195C3AD8|nr:TIGR03086 family metal-binding protein [Lentzea nigeriaca]MBM7858605.1 uncharacterized protein (TIGR03086 family) [Lentzea nigeriaca]
MTELVHAMSEAADGFGRLVRAVAPHQWQLPTPCPDFTVLALVEHVVESLTQYADLVVDQRFDPDFTADLAGADVPAAHRAAAALAIEAWSADSVIEADHPMPWGPVAGRDLAGHLVLEHVVHGWDLAVATGQSSPFHDKLVAAADRIARAHDERVLRQPGMFAAAVPVAADATASCRLAGFLGRRFSG